MVPVAGSAYTYAYATLGELFAWIIGWDLILEYAVASATVAHGWSHYFQDFLDFFRIRFPHIFTNAPFDFDPVTGQLASTGTWFDLPAILTAALTGKVDRELMTGMWLLLYGTGLAACGLFSVPAVFTAGMAFMGLGTATLWLPPGSAHVVLALGFGGIHLALGTTIVRHHGG